MTYLNVFLVKTNIFGKGVAAVTSATRVRFVLGGTIYIAWVPGKEVKTPFFFTKKKK